MAESEQGGRVTRRRRTRTEPDVVRDRLLRAGLRSIATHGYIECTVAQIVAQAQMSRRAFYAHFKDREDCLLAGYELATDALLAEMTTARRAVPRWPERMFASLDAYLASVCARPGLARAFLVEIHRSGPAADLRRITVWRRWAAWLAAESEDDLACPGPPGVERRALSLAQARGVIAGHGQLIADALIEGTPLSDPVLRSDLAHVELAAVTSTVPADPEAWTTPATAATTT